MLQKKVFNEYGNRGTDKIIQGNTTNLREWNRIKYQWCNDIYRTMLNSYWIPEEISLNDDVKNFAQLTDGEKNAFNKTISFLNFLDSIQAENLSHLAIYITAPEITSLLNIQAFQEEIHAQSYSYILDSVTDPMTRDTIYDMWRHDKILLARNKFIANIYQEFHDNKSDINFLKSIVANYILEGIYFYSGFAFFYILARQGKMTATSSIFKYINRDELSHLAIFRNLIKSLREERSDLFVEENIQIIKDMMKQAVDNEVQWGCYITNNEILGINNQLLEEYIKYLANIRLRAIDIEPLFPEITKHPIEWIETFSNINNTKTDFFENKVLNYSKSSVFNIDELT